MESRFRKGDLNLNSAPTQKTLSLSAMAILTLLCASWGLNQVAIKVTNAGISPGFQAGIRSLGAGILIAFWMISRRESMFNRDGTLWWGIGVGLLFAFEFILLYWGLNYTTASRAVVFLYTMPFWVALGATLFIPGERLRPLQVLGLSCAFGGILAAFGESLAGGTKDGLAAPTLLGDLLCLGGALMWAAMTLVVKLGPLTATKASKTLLYLLSVSTVVLFAISLGMGEPGIVELTPLIWVSLVYQTVWVAGITYLMWFWLIIQYPASRLSAFLFLTPLFGVLAGALILDEPLTPMLVAALVLVALGIYLVNRPQPESSH